MTKLSETLYTAQTHTTGGRIGHGTASDKQLDVQLSAPGSNRPGTNPEQLLGVGYSACFLGAMQLAAKQHGIKVPEDAAIDASVSLGKAEDGSGYALAIKLEINLPALEATQKQLLVETAHQTCPYSKALRGSVDIELVIH